jgi:hypothetical protein
MKGDFSRVRFDRDNNYTAVLTQQGRVQLDADANEQRAIDEYLRTTGLTDIVGRTGTPIQNAGMAISVTPAADSILIGPGRYYVDGLLCESDGTIDYRAQPYLIGAATPILTLLSELRLGRVPGLQVWLEAWQRLVTPIDDPCIKDVALGEADTTVRRQTVWRVVIERAPLPSTNDRRTCCQIMHDVPPAIVPGQMTADTDDASGQGHCLPSPQAAYRGLENQLYRVEVHRGGDADDATFKWSRDNGSVEVAIESLTEVDGTGVRTARLAAPWRDARKGLEVGDWVELVDDYWAPVGTPPPLMRVAGVWLHKREVTLEDADRERAFDPTWHPFLRRWDNGAEGAAPNHGIAVTEAIRRWFGLEDGVQVQFDDCDAHYRRGDFWVIPARTATGGVLWPRTSDVEHIPLALRPAGPARYLAPLALATSLDERPRDLRTRIIRQLGECEEDDYEDPRDDDSDSTAIRPAPVLFRLRAVSAIASGHTFDVRPGDTTVGRTPETDIHLEHPDVSRAHAAFSTEGGRLTVRDLRSTNGTWVNDRKIEAEEPVAVDPGDVVTFGTTEARLEVEEP